MIKLTALLLFSIMFGINPVNDDSTKNIINHDWKLNVFALGKGMIPIGQFENNKPIKAIAMMGIKFYWLKEFQIARDINNISDRNRGFWWLLMLNLYGIIDSYVDYHLKDFPIDNSNKINDED